jgi:hypothetical protein
VRKRPSEIRWLRVIGLWLVAGLVCFGGRLAWDWLLIQFPGYPGPIRAVAIVAFGFAIVFLVMKPLAHEFGYDDVRDQGRRN